MFRDQHLFGLSPNGDVADKKTEMRPVELKLAHGNFGWKVSAIRSNTVSLYQRVALTLEVLTQGLDQVLIRTRDDGENAQPFEISLGIPKKIFGTDIDIDDVAVEIGN
ncbi:MAG: hypothetical protein O3C57_06025, partial [Verrucomicrobia bacterium]|nr:hypothetical protein [Verrucomicrobiota bacterium]